MHFETHDRFYARAKQLRSEFDAKFANPLQAHNGRFVWDFWNVPGEYTHLRTPAYTYFSPKLYQHFHRTLVLWGREHLGCHDISPPWLSAYITGCKQEPHQDLPHGPLAWVYSLTPPKRVFTGGETFIQKPKTLITPDFNRLTLFNPSLTHGVREVKGTMDPREGRLVIHGWFVNPRPFWTGGLTIAKVRRALDHDLAQMPFEEVEGFVAFRMKIGRDGCVKQTRVLVDTLNKKGAPDRMAPLLKTLNFGRLKTPAVLTLPLRFG